MFWGRGFYTKKSVKGEYISICRDFFSNNIPDNRYKWDVKIGLLYLIAGFICNGLKSQHIRISCFVLSSAMIQLKTFPFC